MSSDRLIQLVYRRDFDSLRRAVSQGENLNGADGDGRTPLMHAALAADADSEMIRFLVANGADPNAVDGAQRWTALHFAARDQKLAVVQALLDGGAIVDAEDIFGNTPLWRCVTGVNPNLELVRLLTTMGADPDKANRHGASPREIAKRSGKQSVLALWE